MSKQRQRQIREDVDGGINPKIWEVKRRQQMERDRREADRIRQLGHELAKKPEGFSLRMEQEQPVMPDQQQRDHLLDEWGKEQAQ